MKNSVEFEIFGDSALFSEPILRLGGQKMSYQVPTYEAIKGALKHVYWKPSITWVIDEVRVMNEILIESKGIRTREYLKSGCKIAFYSYLKNVRYQVRAHFIFNTNRPEFSHDWNAEKHYAIAQRSIKKGGRKAVFLGASECSAYVVPCVFGEGEGYYDNSGEVDFGVMYHGLDYADEAYADVVPETAGHLCRRFSNVVMKNGVITFAAPEECIHEVIKEASVKEFEVKEVG